MDEPLQDTLSMLLKEHQVAIWWIAAFSSLIFVGSLVIVPWLVVRIPDDYFATERRPHSLFADQHPILRWTGLIVKNLFGVLLVLSGIAMLLLPGQGLLTVAMGMMLLDFPGKHKLERKIIRFPPVRTSVGWLRRKAKANPLRFEWPPGVTKEHVSASVPKDPRS